jgi:hypothetical protein
MSSKWLLIKFSSSHFWAFNRSGPLSCSDSELISETMNPFRNIGRTSWIRVSLHRAALTQKNTNIIHPRLGWIRTRELNVRPTRHSNTHFSFNSCSSTHNTGLVSLWVSPKVLGDKFSNLFEVRDKILLPEKVQKKVIINNIYEGRLKRSSSWTGGSAPLLYIERRWLLCQVVVVGVT